MSALIEVWHAIVAVVAASDAVSLGLALLLAAAAAFAMDRIHSFTGVTLAALAGFGLANFALALALHRAHALDQVMADLWRDFATMTMLTFTAYALIFAGLIAAVAGVRALVRYARG